MTSVEDEITSALYAVVASLAEPERSSVIAAFTADPELADGAATMIAGLPRCMQERLMWRLGARLMAVPLGGGALPQALADVVYERLRREDA
jgi:hypothetical protein